MEFSRNPDLERLIGRVCLIFARVEQEAGHAVASAFGVWGQAMSTDYLHFSSNSGSLLRWLMAVGHAYPEVADDVTDVHANLRALKADRDKWAHSAAVVDLFLMLKEQGGSSMSDGDIDSGRLLNGKQLGHINPPSNADVDSFSARASAVGDAAAALAVSLAALAEEDVRPIFLPRGARACPVATCKCVIRALGTNKT